ncbi:MAG: Tol-Pal system beta propeller repeat protein TolB [Acidobacteriota bacterium]|nr:Tol-Pal system beta propeller repeat protein TolB [Acidobacteriota bacterium]
MKRLAVLLPVLLLLAASMVGQDQIRTGIGVGGERIRIAVPDFATATQDASVAPLNKTFNEVLFNDLSAAGIFDVASRSFYPMGNFAAPQDIKLDAWSATPVKASMVAFGNLGVSNGTMQVQGWLFDTKSPQNPQVLAKQYREQAIDGNARLIAHKFADEIIFRLGGGINGIAESKIFFISTRSGHKEVWAMDYDGAAQHPITHLGSISLSPRVSPDNSRVAFSSFYKGGPNISVYSLELGRMLNFPAFGGTNLSPAWSSDGAHLAFSSSRSGDPEIYVCDANGGNLKRLTQVHGPDVSPVWNPRTNSQIAWVSGRSGLPRIYMMDSDGGNVQKLVDNGYAVSPAWSPNGQYLAFAWIRHYGPGAPGNSDIYIMDVVSKHWIQLTHDGGHNDSPSWSPDGRHIVYQSTRGGGEQIWTMLADGSQQTQLTFGSSNTQPNWSWK